jgi:hypothetical protein
MAQLHAEDGLAASSEGSEFIDGVIEEIINAVVKGEVVRQKILISKYFCFELLDLIKTEERHSQSLFVTFP